LNDSRITAIRVTDPDLDFWVDIRLLRFRGKWMAVADLAGTPEVGVSNDGGLAVLLALWELGSETACRMASQAKDFLDRRR
jgi:hypothetical protein